MTYRPFRSLGRYLLAACAVSLGAASLGAQTPASTAPAPSGSNPSKVDIFMGYSYFGAHGRVMPFGLPYSSINYGAIGSGAYYFNRYFGGEVIYSNHPDGVNDGMSGASGGLIARLPMENFTMFAHGLVGAARLGGPNSEVPATFEHEPYRWGPALTVGGGMDYDLPFFDNRFSLRLFQADFRYIHEDYGPQAVIPTGGILGGRANLDAVELSTGIVMHFGHIIPPPPVTYSCSVAPATGYPGDPITVTGTALNLNPKKTATYTWTSTGGTISGTSSTANVDTKTVAPGNYTITGHVTEGAKPGQSADCTGQFTVKPYDPPTMNSCTANPSTVDSGGSSTITASATSPQNRPLTYSYSASSGSVSGTTSTATLTAPSVAAGSNTSVTVTCNVVDDLGKSDSKMATVTVNGPPVPVEHHEAPQASSLCSVSFERDAKRSQRVDNEAKACLDDVALALQRSSDAKLVLVGNEDAKEKAADAKMAKMKHHKPGAAEARAVNTKDYLVTDKGIDASRIMVYTGTDDAKTVTTSLVPVGAANPAASDTTVDESAVKAVPRTPVAKTRALTRKKK
jgi:hypothetical protein